MADGNTALRRDQELLRRLQDLGCGENHLAAMAENPELVLKVLALIHQEHGFIEPPSHRVAQEIMGQNYLGLKPLVDILGLDKNDESLLGYGGISNPSLLETCKDNLLVCVPQISLAELSETTCGMKIRFAEKARSRKEPPIPTAEPGMLSLKNHSFARDRGEKGWRLLMRTPAPDSERQPMEKQVSLLPKGYRVPTAQTLVFTAIAALRVNGENPYAGKSFRCADIDENPARDRVIVTFDPSGTGARVWSNWETMEVEGVGILGERSI